MYYTNAYMHVQRTGACIKGAFAEFAGFYRWGAKKQGPACFFATKRI